MHAWLWMLLGLGAPWALMADGGDGGAADPGQADAGDGAGGDAPGPEDGGEASGAAAPASGAGEPPEPKTMGEHIARFHPQLGKPRAGGESRLAAGAPESDAEDGAAAEGDGQAEKLADLRKKVGRELAPFVTQEDVGGSAGQVRRIAQMRQKQGHAEREAQRLATENARLLGLLEGKGIKVGGESASAASSPAAPAQAAASHEDPADPRPKAEDFSDPNAFDEADRRWVVRDENRKIEAQRRSRDAQTEQQRGAQAFNDAANSVADRAVELFDDTPQDFGLSPTMVMGVVRIAKTDLDLAATLAHHLATHPEERGRIAKLDAYEQALEIGALRGRLANPGSKAAAGDGRAEPPEPPPAPPAPPAPRPTAAATAPPLRTVRAGGGAPPSPYTAKTMDGYKAARLAEIASGRK